MSIDTITIQGAVEYLKSYVEEMQDRIEQGDPKALLYEERIAFISVAISALKELVSKEESA